MMYFVFCYLAMFGVLLNQYDNINEWKSSDYLALFCAPIVLPIMVGMRINDKRDEQ